MSLKSSDRRIIGSGLANRAVGNRLVDTINFAIANTTGNIFYVDSGSGGAADGAGVGQTPDSPFATLDFAIGQCTANNGDVIVLMPGHAETISADGGVAIDVAGITILGLGSGAARPTFTFSATDATMEVTAASTVICNVVLLGGVDATTGVLEIAAADCALINTEYRDSTGQATDVIITTAAADRLTIDGHRHIGAAGDGGDTAVAVVGCDDVTIRNCELYGNFDLGAIECRTTAAVRLRVHDCQIWTEGAEDLGVSDTVTGSTGIIGPNVFIALQDDAANITTAITGATFYVMDVGVHVVNAVNEKSLAINWTASADA
jgi:hypothetical protein